MALAGFTVEGQHRTALGQEVVRPPRTGKWVKRELEIRIVESRETDRTHSLGNEVDPGLGGLIAVQDVDL